MLTFIARYHWKTLTFEHFQCKEASILVFTASCTWYMRVFLFFFQGGGGYSCFHFIVYHFWENIFFADSYCTSFMYIEMKCFLQH